MIKDWININDVDDLRKVGNFNSVRSLIKQDLAEFREKNFKEDIEMMKVLNITSNSTEGLIKKIKVLKLFILTQRKEIIANSEEAQSENEYFKSEAHELVYYLTQLDGEERINSLKIYKAHYFDEDLAKKWYRDISKKIHPDKLMNTDIKHLDEAMGNLTAIYKSMVDNG